VTADWIPERPMTKEEFGELVQLSTLLSNESLAFYGGLQPSTSSRDRRTFVRAFFASVEAMLWTLRRLSLSRHYAGKYSFSLRELVLLRDEAYDLNDKGQPKTRRSRTVFETTVLFVLRSFAQAYDVQFDEPTSKQLTDFRSMVRVRDRLTHPKRLQDFDVADSELDQLRAAHQWFWTVTLGLMNAIAAAGNKDWI
jgi:hypothetical protein